DQALAANAILRMGQDMRDATDSLLLNGLPVGDLSFEGGPGGGFSYAHTPAVGAENRAVSPSRGGLDHLRPAAGWLDVAFAGQGDYGARIIMANARVPEVGTGGAHCATDGAATSEDIVAVLPYVQEGICRQINRRLHVPDCGTLAC